MLTVDQFLSAVQKNVDRIYEYMLGCDGSNGKCDCIGLIIGAVRLAGEKWTGVHGSNWAIRNAVHDVRPIHSTADLTPGDLVFKSRAPGEARYNLPSRYKNHPDQLDYYHVGVVTSTSPLAITHCTDVPGGIRRDNKLGTWKHAAN